VEVRLGVAVGCCCRRCSWEEGGGSACLRADDAEAEVEPLRREDLGEAGDEVPALFGEWPAFECPCEGAAAALADERALEPGRTPRRECDGDSVELSLHCFDFRLDDSEKFILTDSLFDWDVLVFCLVILGFNNVLTGNHECIIVVVVVQASFLTWSRTRGRDVAVGYSL